MTYRPKTVHLVSHTHWDREWYLTFHTFRVDLVRVVQKVLEALEGDDDFEHFLLDGQAIVLEDYLEVHPEDEGRIRALVERGALAIGPWYVLPDEFLISAEATVRNLQIGHRVSRRFGGAQRVGYMPDSFGHVAQMPQILARAGLDSFIYTRGNGDEIDELGHEFIWEAPDGSEVLAINQCGGYCNAAGLGFDEIWHAHTRREVRLERAVEQVGELFEKMAPRSRGDIVLLGNGCDHFPPQARLGPIMAALREAFPGTEFRHSSLEAFVDAVREAGFATGRYRGELIHGKLHHILSGVWSARMHLKQRNDEAQTLLAGQLEPLSAYTHFQLMAPYPGGLIEDAWKRLLANHPHDSICGCSIDEVHREMGPRFDGVIETAERSMARQLEDLAPTFARRADGDRHTLLCVANTLPRRRTEVVERLVVVPDGVDADGLHLLDEQGREVPWCVLERYEVKRFWGVDFRRMLFADKQQAAFGVYRESFQPQADTAGEHPEARDCYLHIQFLAEDLPPVGHVTYRLTDTAGVRGSSAPGGGVTVEGSSLENEHCRVDVHPDGSFDLLDKATGRLYPGLNVLEDTEDVGDEYDYAPCAASETILSEGIAGDVKVLRGGGLAGAVEVVFGFALPASIEADRRSRSAKRVECPVSVRVALRQGSPLVEVEVGFDNRVCDHRLRARFPAAIKTSTVISDGHFYTNERSIEHPTGEGWVQPPPGTYPQQDFSLLQDGQGGLAVFNRGLPEFEAVAHAAPTLEASSGGIGLALTLLRAVGWLSRDDFGTRCRSHAGPMVATPEAQCPGPQRFRYAVAPFSGDWVEARIKDLGQRWRTPPLVFQGVEDQAVSGGDGLLEVTTNLTCVTAIKKHDDRDTLLVRLYNLTGSPVEETLRFGRDVRGAWRANILEERGEPVGSADKRSLRLTLAPHEIAGLEVEFGRE